MRSISIQKKFGKHVTHDHLKESVVFCGVFFTENGNTVDSFIGE